VAKILSGVKKIADLEVFIHSYDTAGRTTDVTDPNGSITHTTYDAYGTPATLTYAYGTMTPRTWQHAFRINRCLGFGPAQSGQNRLTPGHDRLGCLGACGDQHRQRRLLAVECRCECIGPGI